MERFECQLTWTVQLLNQSLLAGSQWNYESYPTQTETTELAA